MNIKIIEKYNKPGPRYTSYPPATFFTPEIGPEHYRKMVEQSNQHQPQNISVYIHIPFCKQLCHFCGCNTSAYTSDDLVKVYIEALLKEIDTVSQYIDTSRPLTQIHWGGGTPNAISLAYTEKVMQRLLAIFKTTPGAEIAMECNPALLDPDDVDQLADMGFNRLSLGIQDFDPEVLRVVNRKPSRHPVEMLAERIHKNKMDGLNIDLIYGLPGQTPESFGQSVKKAIEIRPDRLVTFSYAHVPWVKSAQKVLEQYRLPTPEEKLAMFETAYNLLLANGYESIGMDHYALPADELAVARRNNKLHRNFQGYCTRETTGQVYGFGSTSISQLQGGYYQNLKSTQQYIDAINNHGIATERGYELSESDQVVRTVINEIMCNGQIDFDAIAREKGITRAALNTLTRFTPEKLEPYINDNLIELTPNGFRLKENGFMVVRNLAMEFDPLLGTGTGQYSKTV